MDKRQSLILNVVRPVEDTFCLDELSRRSSSFPEEANQEQVVKQLAAGIAHHYNNIFQTIISAVELVRLYYVFPGPVYKDLARIIQQSQQGAHLTDQLLDFSCQADSAKRVTDLAYLLEGTTRQLKYMLPASIQLDLEIAPEDEAYLLKADTGQIEQMLFNLVTNAREAMPDGGRLTIRLSSPDHYSARRSGCPDRPSDREYVLAISDTGRGISADDLPHIFEPFFTTKEVGQGPGLGLAQVYGIVKQHGGTVNVVSQAGRGTTFTLYLPALVLT
jgi:two-component system cell cycle sensor histidine kinase/response regulator CckA